MSLFCCCDINKCLVVYWLNTIWIARNNVMEPAMATWITNECYNGLTCGCRATYTYLSNVLHCCLTHWDRVTHICVSKITIIGSDNGLSPDRRQAIIWTNVGILFIRTIGTNFSEILSEIHTFSFKKMNLKMSSAKWRPFCLGLNVLRCWWLVTCRAQINKGWRIVKWTPGTISSEILNKMKTISREINEKIDIKLSPVKWQPVCLDPSV